MENEDLIKNLEKLAEKSTGRVWLRFILNSLGSWIPVVSAASSVWGEKEQQKFNDLIVSISNDLFDEVDRLSGIIESIINEPSAEGLITELGQMFTADVCERLFRGEFVPVVISQSSLTELMEYKKKGYISLESTGAIAQMGTGCRVGNHIEEIKYPYGIGMGFIIKLLIVNIRS